jgi:hypothetical protein
VSVFLFALAGVDRYTPGMDTPDRPAGSPRPAFSIPSILAVICAIISFKAGAVLGMVMAILAIVLGLIGLALALSPRTRGGIVSFISIVAGLIGIIAAVFKLFF